MYCTVKTQFRVYRISDSRKKRKIGSYVKSNLAIKPPILVNHDVKEGQIDDVDEIGSEEDEADDSDEADETIEKVTARVCLAVVATDEVQSLIQNAPFVSMVSSSASSSSLPMSSTS